MLPGLLLSPDCCAAEWCQGVGATAAALPAGVALQQWQAPLLANHTDDFKGERCTMQAAGCRLQAAGCRLQAACHAKLAGCQAASCQAALLARRLQLLLPRGSRWKRLYHAGSICLAACIPRVNLLVSSSPQS